MQAELGSRIESGAVPVHYAYVARYAYSDVVVQNDNFLRLSAYTDQRQEVESCDVRTEPPGRTVMYSDRLGNVVHRVRVVTPHEQLVIAAFGKVLLRVAAPPVDDVPLSSLADDLEAE